MVNPEANDIIGEESPDEPPETSKSNADEDDGADDSADGRVPPAPPVQDAPDRADEEDHSEDSADDDDEALGEPRSAPFENSGEGASATESENNEGDSTDADGSESDVNIAEDEGTRWGDEHAHDKRYVPDETAIERRTQKQQRQADESGTESAARMTNREEVDQQETRDESMSSNTPSGDDSSSSQNATDAVSDIGQRLSWKHLGLLLAALIPVYAIVFVAISNGVHHLDNQQYLLIAGGMVLVAGLFFGVPGLLRLLEGVNNIRNQ